MVLLSLGPSCVTGTKSARISHGHYSLEVYLWSRWTDQAKEDPLIVYTNKYSCFTRNLKEWASLPTHIIDQPNVDACELF